MGCCRAMDHLSPERRSWLMSRVGSRNTRPEKAVRTLLHALGYRFRVNYKALPGTPDIVFTKRKKVVFVHGCFWHGHIGCRYARLPKTRTEFWAEKMRRNRERDDQVFATLKSQGWSILVVWQCELDDSVLTKRLVAFLGECRV